MSLKNQKPAFLIRRRLRAKARLLRRQQQGRHRSKYYRNNHNNRKSHLHKDECHPKYHWEVPSFRYRQLRRILRKEYLRNYAVQKQTKNRRVLLGIKFIHTFIRACFIVSYYLSPESGFTTTSTTAEAVSVPNLLYPTYRSLYDVTAAPATQPNRGHTFTETLNSNNLQLPLHSQHLLPPFLVSVVNVHQSQTKFGSNNKYNHHPSNDYSEFEEYGIGEAKFDQLQHKYDKLDQTKVKSRIRR